MKKVAMFLLTASLVLPVFSAPQRIAIIKADDVQGSHPKWERCFKIADEMGIKVSAGIICDSIEKQGKDYADWLKKWSDSGKVEFWNHGWDHKRWDEKGEMKSEFGGSGYDHQIEHLNKSQDAFKAAIGRDFTTFGSPYNAMDKDTATALNRISGLKLIFCNPGAPLSKEMKDKILLPMTLRGEHDGTGKPNFEKFKADYEKKDNPKLSFAAIQFHPLAFSEKGFKDYAAILDFLKSEGWTFMLPSEYAASFGKNR
jgi:peptidoglycan/xylan/chitin deacetylase (PgdA/CDA1 family)